MAVEAWPFLEVARGVEQEELGLLAGVGFLKAGQGEEVNACLVEEAKTHQAPQVAWVVGQDEVVEADQAGWVGEVQLEEAWEVSVV